MRIRDWLSIGVILMLLASCSGQGSLAQDTPASFHETMIDGRLGFKLLIPETTWKQMTQPAPGLTSVLLDEQVHTSVDAMIELGIRRRHLPCSHQWLMSEMGPADIGGVLFIGLCATPREILAVEAEKEGRTT